ncbi:unnamed protein product [Ambrosiozyma monospora]|uniref:Unnamed protein product n=1 Tax=Ambrosiozyma monospora TaxID=43982 RepID=A0A9W6YX14_AMBMO|nr:unnamed protein product [Ambrosiozyma monospora]
MPPITPSIVLLSSPNDILTPQASIVSGVVELSFNEDIPVFEINAVLKGTATIKEKLTSTGEESITVHKLFNYEPTINLFKSHDPVSGTTFQPGSDGPFTADFTLGFPLSDYQYPSSTDEPLCCEWVEQSNSISLPIKHSSSVAFR